MLHFCARGQTTGTCLYVKSLEPRNLSLEPRNLSLEPRNLSLEPRNLSLEPRNLSLLDSQLIDLSREFRPESLNQTNQRIFKRHPPSTAPKATFDSTPPHSSLACLRAPSSLRSPKLRRRPNGRRTTGSAKTSAQDVPLSASQKASEQQERPERGKRYPPPACLLSGRFEPLSALTGDRGSMYWAHDARQRRGS